MENILTQLLPRNRFPRLTGRLPGDEYNVTQSSLFFGEYVQRDNLGTMNQRVGILGGVFGAAVMAISSRQNPIKDRAVLSVQC